MWWGDQENHGTFYYETWATATDEKWSKKGGRECLTTQRQCWCLKLALYIIWDVSKLLLGFILITLSGYGWLAMAGHAACLGGVARSSQWHCKPPHPATSTPQPWGDRAWSPAVIHPCSFPPCFPGWAWQELELLPIVLTALHEVRHLSAASGNKQTTSLGHQATCQWWLLSVMANLACFCVAMAVHL